MCSVLPGVCSTRRGGRLQGFDGYKLNLERDKSYILTRLQQTLSVQLDTKACTRNAGVCFRSILITLNGKIIYISMEPGDSEVGQAELCLYIVYTAHGILYLQSTQAGGINTQGTVLADAACLHFIITQNWWSS